MDDSYTSGEADGACTKNGVENSVNLPMESCQNSQAENTVALLYTAQISDT